MCVALIAEVYRREVGGLACTALLALLANYASPDGDGIFPSKPTMAAALGTTKPTVIAALRDLMRDGLVREVGERRIGTGLLKEYAIDLDQLTSRPLTPAAAREEERRNRSKSFTGKAALPVKELDPTGKAPLPQGASSFTQPVREQVREKKKGANTRQAKPAVFDFACPDGVDPRDWDGLLANRKAKQIPPTEAAHRGILRILDQGRSRGLDPGRLVADAAMRGWCAVFLPNDRQARVTTSVNDDPLVQRLRAGRGEDG
jgi:hypothetical protein